ncbi:MAG: J domain-containing protein [Vulcanococcus sp.]
MAAANSSATHYQLLQISPEASGTELRQAFRSLSKRYHPDTTELPEQEASEAFRRLQQAYLTLSDPERRRAYDATLRAIAPAPAPRLGSAGSPRPVQPQPVRRALSGGEWFALLLLALAVVFSLVLGVGLAWARGAEFLRPPSWWTTAGQTAGLSPSTATDVGPAAGSGAALQPSPAGAGALAERAGGGAARAEFLPVGSAAPGLDG